MFLIGQFEADRSEFLIQKKTIFELKLAGLRIEDRLQIVQILYKVQLCCRRKSLEGKAGRLILK